MVSPLIPSFERTFVLIKGELSGLWFAIYRGLANQRRLLAPEDNDNVRWTLRHWEADNIVWNVHGSQRMDLDVSTFKARSIDSLLMRHIRPPQERAATDTSEDPFAVNPGGDGKREMVPSSGFLLPFYMLKYYGLL